jgi:arylformamidase
MVAGLIDITRPLDERVPAWPGDARLHRECRSELVGDSSCKVTSFGMSAHLGTHVDAPAHLSEGEGAASIDAVDLAVFVGPARVVDARGVAVVDAQLVQRLSDCPPRILLRTDNSDRPYDVQSFVWLAPDAADALVSRACILVGVDGPSPDPPDSLELPAHRRLLDAGTVVVEGLDLHGVPEGNYELICLPLALRGAEAAPARALLRPLR